MAIMPRIETVEVSVCRLEIPLKDIDELPHRLGCQASISGDAWVLTDGQPQCALRFRLEQTRAVLVEVSIHADLRGRFFQQVLGALLVEYQGDFLGTVEWNTPEGTHTEVRVDAGESAYPLFAVLIAGRPSQQPLEAPRESGAEPSRLDRHLDEARAAWDEYQRLKAQREPKPRGG